MSTINELIQKIDDLKPISRVTSQIITLAEDSKSSMSDFANIIQYDSATTANLLRTCNSAAMGLSRKVESVRDAITLMGLEQVVDLVLIKNSTDNLKTEQPGYGLDEGALWRQSVASAMLSKELCQKHEVANQHLVFTAALLKDIGKVVLSRFVADEFKRINELVENDGLSFREAEKQIIGVDHAELGAMVAKKWNFSSKMISIIKNHHLTDESQKNDLETAIVYAADTICMMMGIGGGADGLAYHFFNEVFSLLEISEKDLQIIMASFAQNLEKVENLFTAV